MKRKYFAYLHRNDHWVIKLYTTRKRFMEIVEDGLTKDSLVMGMIMPFELDLPMKEWEKKLERDGWISLDQVPATSIKESPVLQYIKNLILRIDWNKA